MNETGAGPEPHLTLLIAGLIVPIYCLTHRTSQTLRIWPTGRTLVISKKFWIQRILDKTDRLKKPWLEPFSIQSQVHSFVK